MDPLASSPPPLPVVPAERTGATSKWLLSIAASLTAIVLGLVTLILLGISTGPLGLMVGIVLAVLPVPAYMLLALWVDRFEKEPVWMLAAGFLWGATAAVFFAYILNTAFAVVMFGVLGDGAEVAVAVVSAPLVEELAKGFALIILFLWKREEFDSVLDGIIYATMIGLGFAMTENILYYGKSLAEGLGASIFTFILRGVVSPFAHPLFTSMTGIGLGLARHAPRGSWMKVVAPASGLCLAMFLHFLWNGSASLGAMFFLAYVLIMVPAFLGVITIVILSLRKEGRIIREHLLPELRSGFLPEREYHALCTARGRIGAAWRAFGSGGWSQRRARIRLQDLASELAFLRWRTARGISPRHQTPAEREAGYVAQLNALAVQLGWMPAARAAIAPPLPIPPPYSAAAAPRSGGFKGVLIAVSSIGCLGVLALGVVVVGLALYGASLPETNPPVVQADEWLERQPLTALLPEQIGAFQRESSDALDSNTAAIVGATQGLAGEYSSDMTLLLLRYRSAELAANATESLRLAWFPETDGWAVAPKTTAAPAHRFDAAQTSEREAAAVWNYGSLVLIFRGDAEQMPQFAAPGEVATMVQKR